MSLTLPGQTLRAVAAKIRQLSYVPTSWNGVLACLSADGRSQLEPLLVEMVGEGGQPRLMALMLERLAERQEALQQERDSWSFVWSGPEALHSKTADTFAIVDQLINQAQHSLLIATHNIGTSKDILEQLKDIATRLETGQLQQLKLIFHPKQIEKEIRASSHPAETVSTWFYTNIWPWQAKPMIFVDSRVLSPSWAWGPYQHAKALIADPGLSSAKALLTSANFSESAHRFNFEGGWLVSAPWRVEQINDHFLNLISSGLFVQIKTPLGHHGISAM